MLVCLNHRVHHLIARRLAVISHLRAEPLAAHRSQILGFPGSNAHLTAFPIGKFDIFCHAVLLGGLQRISSLALTGNNIGCAGVTALSLICARGALPNLTAMFLSAHRICDPGIQAFANVYAGGVFRHLEVLYLTSNRVGDAGVSAMVAAACD